MKIESNDNYCFLWSILVYLHPFEINHPKRVSNYKKYFNEINIEGFDFTNGFKCSDVHKYEKLNILSINIFRLNFYQDQNKWRHNLKPIEFKKKDSDKVIDLLVYKNEYVLINILNVF